MAVTMHQGTAPSTRTQVEAETIVLVAHDRRCIQLVDLAICYRDILCAHHLFGSPTTARVLREMAGLRVEPLGVMGVALGQELLAKVSSSDVAAVVLLEDAFGIASDDDVDFRILMAACNMRNVPLATNIATASAVLNALSLLREAVRLEDPSVPPQIEGRARPRS